jgi:fatty-acyl-CoA synthase
MGEVVMRGDNVMKGYFADEAATTEAFRGGWFHSGDLAVMHPDGYIEIRERAKDIIISGGENISTVEVERVLVSHPDVLEAAVVAMPDEKAAPRLASSRVWVAAPSDAC